MFPLPSSPPFPFLFYSLLLPKLLFLVVLCCVFLGSSWCWGSIFLPLALFYFIYFPPLPFCSPLFNSNLWIRLIRGLLSSVLLLCLLVLLLFSKLHLWRTKPLVPTWIQPFVCLPEEGKGTRQPLWFTVGLGPAWLWPLSSLVIVSPCSSSLSFSLFPSLIFSSNFSLCSIYLPFAPLSPGLISSRKASVFTLILPKMTSNFLSFFLALRHVVLCPSAALPAFTTAAMYYSSEGNGIFKCILAACVCVSDSKSYISF